MSILGFGGYGVLFFFMIKLSLISLSKKSLENSIVFFSTRLMSTDIKK